MLAALQRLWVVFSGCSACNMFFAGQRLGRGLISWLYRYCSVLIFILQRSLAVTVAAIM